MDLVAIMIGASAVGQPLFSSEVPDAARAAGTLIPMVSFSNDRSAARPGPERGVNVDLLHEAVAQLEAVEAAAVVGCRGASSVGAAAAAARTTGT